MTPSPPHSAAGRRGCPDGDPACLGSERSEVHGVVPGDRWDGEYGVKRLGDRGAQMGALEPDPVEQWCSLGVARCVAQVGQGDPVGESGVGEGGLDAAGFGRLKGESARVNPTAALWSGYISGTWSAVWTRATVR